jgi:gliding motility-associated-like protein
MKHTVLIKLALVLLFSFIGSQSSIAQQIPICLSNDATICPGQTAQIQDCLGIGSGAGGGLTIGSYQVETIPYTPDPLNVGTAVNLSDDSQSALFNIGFNFCFFGTTYTQFVIGSNGWVAFSTPQPNTFTSAIIPSAAANVPKNCVMGPWQDWHPGVGPNVGQYIRYQLYGTAPNRRLVISYNQIPMFSCTTTYGTFQIKIYETTNVVETHIGNKPNCLQWAGGTATHGLHNAAGTQAVIVPGRNSTVWTTTNEGYRFTPGVQWVNSLGQTFPYNGGNLNVTPPPAGGTVGYWLTGGCGVGSNFAISDTTWLNFSLINVSTPTTVTDFCSGGVGSATINSVTGTYPPFTYLWSPSGQTTQNATNIVGGPHTLTITDNVGCTNQISVTVPNNQPTASSTFTPESCVGSSNGTATATMNPPIGTLTYQWNDPLQQTTQTAVGLTAGTYTCTITSSQNCTVTTTVTVIVDNPMQPSIASQTDVTCHAANNGTASISITNGAAPFNFIWSGSNSTSNTANDLFAGNQTVFITDANGCNAQLSFILNEPPALQLTSISNPQEICPGATANLTAQGTGGSSPYIFTWYSNGAQVAQGQNVVVTPNDYLTTYCVVLTEQCGSPSDTMCTTVSWPADIIPSFISDTTRGCNPTTIAFQNSTESNIIANILFQFGDGSSINVNPTQPFTHTYTYAGNFTPQMTVTTINGCVYTQSFPNYIQIGDYPQANFSWYPSQPVMFNPVANMVDMSSSDVTQWLWNFEAGEPGASSSQNPAVSFPLGEVDEYLVTLVVTNDFGCTDTFSTYVPVISDVLIFAPNTFTPDNDNHNQTWQVYMQGIDIYDFNLLIFNRWGEIVWESNNIAVPWDGTYNGKPVSNGTYIWKIRTKNPYNDNVYEFQGHVNVLR